MNENSKTIQLESKSPLVSEMQKFTYDFARNNYRA